MNMILYVVIGLVAGVCGGMFGIGGATILIPAFVYLLGFTQHQAQGTTLAILVPPIGLLAAWRYWQSGNVKMSIALFVCLGFFIGGWIGASLAHHVGDLPLKRLFGVFLLLVSLRMMLGK
ncbi:MAG: sulfite exporter TauE/SafE family protein [Candidatus Omnitrophica bacterium]|nr:sulfite exporter TauE/SafE family protein [Candidatus Omnitrophota bacterium]